MEDKVLLDNIERAMRAKGTTADAVSKAAKRPDAIRNLRRRVRGQFSGSMTLDTLADIAKHLDVPMWELLRPPGAMPQDESFKDAIRAVVDEEFAAREAPSRPQKRKHR